MASFVSGAAFGAAMLAAGFHQPSVVISQLKLENWHMFQAFLTATASSAAIYTAAERLGYLKLQPRGSSPLGLFGKFDGNILGGSLLGIGMALAGACPGTLLTQVAVGVRTGIHALNGAVLGGIIWTGISKSVKQHREAAGVKSDVVTISDQLGVSRGAAFLLLEFICLAVVAATTVYTPRPAEVRVLGAVGGLFIAAAQLVSLITRRSMMGVSGSYEEIGNSFWWFVKGADSASRPRSYQNILFGSGLVAGAWTLSQLSPSVVTATVTEVSPLLATVGGALMVVGSRMAGGCTSGHGISGMSLLSVSSIVTIASTFAAGLVVTPLVH